MALREIVRGAAVVALYFSSALLDMRAQRVAAPAAERFETAYFRASYRGLEPAHLTVRTGRIQLYVYSDDLVVKGFRIEGGGRLVSEAKGNGRSSKYRTLLILPPGTYQILAPEHPRWRATLQVTPN